MPPTCSAAGHRLNRLSASYGETQSSATSSGRQRARPIRHSKGCCEPTVLQMVAAEVRRCAMTWQSSAWPDDPDVTHPTDIPQSAGVRRRHFIQPGSGGMTPRHGLAALAPRSSALIRSTRHSSAASTCFSISFLAAALSTPGGAFR